MEIPPKLKEHINNNRGSLPPITHPDEPLPIDSLSFVRLVAPYFVLSSDAFQQLCEAGPDGDTYVWPAAIGNVLCCYRKSIPEDVPDGLNVILPLDNKGATARGIRIETSLKNCVLCQEPDLNSGPRRIFLKYQYDRALHGTPVNLKVTFKSSNGYRSTQTYKTVHGEFVFERVDPR